MKLATLHDGSRDGQLAVVSRDLAVAHFASGIVGALQRVLDDWNFLSPQLERLYATLNDGKARHAFPFDPRRCMAPLPRAFQWVDGSAYPSHIERLRTARGAGLPERVREEPLTLQGGSDGFLGPCDDAAFPVPAGADWGIDFGAGLAVVTGDLPMGVAPEVALEGVRLLMLVNGWSLRGLIPDELSGGNAGGSGLLHGKPATAFGPLAVTPDELGSAWQGGRVHLSVTCQCNGARVGHCDAGAEMQFHFGHLARTRRVRAGSIVGGGTVSLQDASQGVSCIAERRAIELREIGAAQTPYLRLGDTVRIEVTGADGQSVFGAIEQRVVLPAA
jgi:fumarylacetoacetate (FAA) hydrolase